MGRINDFGEVGDQTPSSRGGSAAPLCRSPNGHKLFLSFLNVNKIYT